ncbi:hypothetical protein C5167_044525 [Papaver somniferum]|uniref:LOB domain-containing protein n=1 Tax=Papaver somniferum TaxID=3469 RepID=A0A4Y7L9Q4_PAPSO|nr:uncharacterized protein LOC113319334 [Papaver somniferum]RZC81966.1 hypothetical protein C5167_044525 [Papaver somniferum]
MDIHQLCIVCKYWRISPWAQPQPGCLHERHHRLFRADDIVATFMYYNTGPSSVLPNTDYFNRIRVRDSTRRFEAAIRSHDDVYGITGIIILLESILYVNSVLRDVQMFYARYYGLYPPAAVPIRQDYPERPRQQTPSFSNSLVSSTSAQHSQRTPSFSNSLVSTSAHQSQQTTRFSNSLVSSNSAQQSQHQRCTACIYLARNCPVDCWFAEFFQEDFWGDFEAVCHTKFERTYLAYNSRTRRQELTGDEITQIRATTTLFEREIRARSCPDYGATGIVITLVRRLLAVNASIDFLEEISADRVQQLVEQYHSRQVPRYPAPTNVNTGGPGQQQHFQRGVAKRTLEQGGPPIPQQRPRLPGPPIPLQPPRLQQPAQFVLLHHPTPFQQPSPPAAFQQPSYDVQMQGYQARPLPQSQEPAMPSQSEQLLAGINSSSTATSSQSQFQSQQHHYFSSGISSSAAAVGQPHPHHQEPPDPYGLATIQFSDDEKDTYWGKEQKRLAEEQKQLYQGLPPYQVQMQGYETPPVSQSQEPAVPSQSQHLFTGTNSSSTATSSQSQFQSQQQHYLSSGISSSAAAVGQPHPHHQEPPDPYGLATIQFSDDEKDTYWGKEQKQLKEGPR